MTCRHTPRVAGHDTFNVTSDTSDAYPSAPDKRAGRAPGTPLTSTSARAAAGAHCARMMNRPRSPQARQDTSKPSGRIVGSGPGICRSLSFGIVFVSFSRSLSVIGRVGAVGIPYHLAGLRVGAPRTGAPSSPRHTPTVPACAATGTGPTGASGRGVPPRPTFHPCARVRL